MKKDQPNYPFGNIMKSIDGYFQDKPSPYYLQSIDQFFNRNRRSAFSLEVFETDNNLKIEAQLPGIAKKDIRINLYDNELGIAVRGLKRDGSNISENEIEQTVPLPFKVRESDIKATYVDGMLRIILPKVRKIGKQIIIKEESDRQN
jgi:HSP20 family protein